MVRSLKHDLKSWPMPGGRFSICAFLARASNGGSLAVDHELALNLFGLSLPPYLL
jgi:hypothetical protein